MKRLFVLILLGSLLAPHLILAQESPKSAAPTLNPAFQGLPGFPASGMVPAQPPPPDLRKFDLDFPGGTPAELVAFIQAAIHTRLNVMNVIVPNEYADTVLPALKMKDITVPELFEALGEASKKVEINKNSAMGPYPQSLVTYSYGFKTLGTPREDSIWYFFVLQWSVRSSRPSEPKTCRFYQLGPLLLTYKVEDITTAIETGWKMLGETNVPELKFHKDTQLLIAVGQPDKLILIEFVLEELKKGGKASGSQPSPAKVEPKVEPAKP